VAGCLPRRGDKKASLDAAVATRNSSSSAENVECAAEYTRLLRLARAYALPGFTRVLCKKMEKLDPTWVTVC